MTAPVVPENITVLVECRQEARRNKEFEKADSIRAELFSHGWTVEDDNDMISNIVDCVVSHLRANLH